MDRSPFLKAIDAAGAATRDAGRRAQVAAPSAQGRVLADPDDLVARALGILAETSQHSIPAETPSWHHPGASGSWANDNAKTFGTPSPDLLLQRRVLSDGTECPLPIRYFDVQCLVATFLTDLDRAAELLRGTGLQVLSQDEKAVVLLYCIEYRITDIGPYNEVGLTIMAKAPCDPIPAIYVAHLPVTTAVANRAGREIWGYNKFVAAIDVRSDGKSFSTILRDLDKATIGVFEGRLGASVPVPPTDILTFTVLNGKLMKTHIQVLTPAQAGSGEGFVLKVGTSGHPMTNDLRTLGLDGAHPLLVQYTDPFQALLFPGRAL